jgi:1-acyl-sn-glycerol-3-phosphate acyltransferase
MIAAWTMNFTGCCIAAVVLFGAKTPNSVSAWRYKLFCRSSAFHIRMILMMFGVVYATEVQVDESMEDHQKVIELYRKFLGPDWTPKYTGAGLSVSNHQSMFDIFTLFLQPELPAFLAKKEIRKVPGVGFMAEMIQSLFIDR